MYLLGKWNKTALMYAVKNGHSAVAAYLLRIGVNPCSLDTSGNTPIHYAAAYGWLHCLKMLIKAGADPNAANQWKVSRGPSRLTNSSSSPSSYFFVVILYLHIFIFFVFIYLCILRVHSTSSSGLPSASPLCSPTASYAFQFFSRPPSCLHISPHCILMFM